MAIKDNRRVRDITGTNEERGQRKFPWKKPISQCPALQIVCFKVGKEEYGIDILKVQEILKLPKITRLPKSAEFIMGVMDLRGKVIPIIDLSKRFRIENGSAGVGETGNRGGHPEQAGGARD
ncbi:MAG: chemotaxis protein CheW [Spirochaetota bacterium]